MKDTNEIIIYQPEEAIELEVRLEDETVWLTQAQLAELQAAKQQNDKPRPPSPSSTINH